MTTSPETQATEPEVAAARTVEPAGTTELSIDFGRIDSQGNVWVQDGDTERMIGSFPEGLPSDPFALYTRRYADLEATIKLFEDRLASLGPKEIDQTLATLKEAVEQPNAIGDLPALRARVQAAEERAQARKEEAKEERRLAKEHALEERTALVERAEAILAKESSKIHWKQSGQVLRDLLEEWKQLQRRGPRLDKAAEDELWKRFSATRTQFDRRRRQYFSELDERQGQAKRVKEEIIARAEALKDSTNWGETSNAFRELMEQWKRAPRASRREDDALWARFRAAQQAFFDARHRNDLAVDSEYQANLSAKEDLLKEAEALLPITNHEEAKAALRSIQDRWAEIGRVPSEHFRKVEARLRAVEDELRKAEEAEWRRTNPETRARATGMLGQLEEQLDQLRADLEEAKTLGDEAKVRELTQALETKQAWFDQISSSLS